MQSCGAARECPPPLPSPAPLADEGDRSEQLLRRVQQLWEQLVADTVAAVAAGSVPPIAGSRVGLPTEGEGEGRGPASQLQAVEAAVTAVGRQLWASARPAAAGAGAAAAEPFAFPLAWLVQLLELQLAAEAEEEGGSEPAAGAGWLSVRCLSAIGVPWTARYVAYTRLLDHAM